MERFIETLYRFIRFGIVNYIVIYTKYNIYKKLQKLQIMIFVIYIYIINKKLFSSFETVQFSNIFQAFESVLAFVVYLVQ